jgi:hypothetical protein
MRRAALYRDGFKGVRTTAEGDSFSAGKMVDGKGIEPSTSALRTQRSPS